MAATIKQGCWSLFFGAQEIFKPVLRGTLARAHVARAVVFGLRFVEDIYLKCFEVAPKRFSWRTRPDLPDSKRASKALAEAEKHTDFILKINPYTRRLSAEGLAWIESQLPQLQKAFGEAEVPPPRTNQHMRLQRDLKSHAIWKSFEDGTESDLIHILADALRCSPASPHAVWGTRFSALEIAANHLQDPELLEFLKFAVAVYEDSKGGTN